MNCPVCQAAGLPEELKKCPQCESDLEVFQFTRSMERTSQNRLWFGVVTTVLLITALFLWFFLGRTAPSSEDTDALKMVQVENELLKAELQRIKTDHERLQTENSELKQKLADDTRDTSAENNKTDLEQVEEYIVQNGETLYGIAGKFYGNGLRYTEIARDNNITDPEIIRTGQKLIIRPNR